MYTKIIHYSGVNEGYLPLCPSEYISSSTYNIPVDKILRLRGLDPKPDKNTEEDNIPYADVLAESPEENERERGEIYLEINAQYQKNIVYLVESGCYVLVGGRK